MSDMQVVVAKTEDVEASGDVSDSAGDTQLVLRSATPEPKDCNINDPSKKPSIECLFQCPIVDFRLGERVIPIRVHQFVLKGSPYLQKMFSDAKATGQMPVHPACDVYAFEQYIRYLYCGTFEDCAAMALAHMYVIAAAHEDDGLKNTIVHKINDKYTTLPKLNKDKEDVLAELITIAKVIFDKCEDLEDDPFFDYFTEVLPQFGKLVVESQHMTGIVRIGGDLAVKVFEIVQGANLKKATSETTVQPGSKKRGRKPSEKDTAANKRATRISQLDSEKDSSKRGHGDD